MKFLRLIEQYDFLCINIIDLTFILLCKEIVLNESISIIDTAQDPFKIVTDIIKNIFTNIIADAFRKEKWLLK